jgi:periplasmic divalent cation tolerance protein
MSLSALADHPAILVLCTCPGEELALELARTLVRERLAACVNRVPGVLSVYQWEGRICEESEQLLVIKTTPLCYPALEMRLKTLHPYEIPEIIVIPVVTGSGPYLAWLGAATDPVSAASTPLSVHPT